MRYLDLKEEMEAYHWFMRAYEQGFIPSQNNLKKMNLLYLLLPNEILSKIASYLTMQELVSFKTVSERVHYIADHVITSTNYLTSNLPCAKYISSLFSKVVFEPQPQSIRVSRLVETKKGSVEIHFRDTQHLKEVVEHTPLVKAEEKVYFVRDEEAKDGKEFIALKGENQRSYFINVTADGPLKLKGELQTSSVIFVPRGSDINSLNSRGLHISIGTLDAYNYAHYLADIIETFSEAILQIRTQDAESLFKSRRKSRVTSPQLYPSLEEICPNVCMLSGSEIRTLQEDYIHADSPPVYIGNSIQAVEDLRANLPEYNRSIGYIDAKSKYLGIYSKSPLSVIKGFKIFSDEHLTVIGKMPMQDYIVTLRGKKGLWCFGMHLVAQSITLSSEGGAYHGHLHRIMEANTKPQNMPNEEWERFLTTGLRNGWFQ